MSCCYPLTYIRLFVFNEIVRIYIMRFLYLFESVKIIIVLASVGALLTFSVNQSYAITGAKDTITTSRPSPSSPLDAVLATTDTQATIFSNGSRFLASDSAKLIKTATTSIVDAGTIVSSQSGGLTTVYFGQQAGAQGFDDADVLYVPVTAMHVVEFTVGVEIPVSGIFRLTFPNLATGDADNDASPSATTFQFNNVVSGTGGRDNIEVWNTTDGEITSNVTITETEPSAGSPGIITFTLDGATNVLLGETIRIFIGCTASSVSSCTTQAPRIINPTKTQAVGTADSWKIGIATRTAADTALENTTIGIATNETVTIRATVDPTLSFTIAGINSGTDLADGNSGCGATPGVYGQTANTGINSTANEVNLGVLQNTPSAGSAITNLAGQLITISTNGSTGYALTATSASSLLNPETGYIFFANQTPLTPTNFTAGGDFFGLHACGNDVTSAWVEGSPGGGSDCNFFAGPHAPTTDECFWSWPNPGNKLSDGVTLPIASDTVGPVGTGTGETGDGITSVAYGAGIDVLVPPGEYRAIITYIATPSF